MTHKELSKKMADAIGLTEAAIAVYYSDEKPDGAFQWNCEGGHFCSIGRLAAVRGGTPMAVDGENPGCMGMAFYLGWKSEVRPGFEYFLSKDAEGNGERFKKTPELARTTIDARKFVPANGRYCIFQRFEDVPEDITPEVIAFFANPDGISGLVWLANYGRPGLNAVIAPFSAGCGSIVGEPRAEALQ